MGTKPDIVEQIKKRQHEIREARDAVGWSNNDLAAAFLRYAPDSADAMNEREGENLAESIKKALSRASSTLKMLGKLTQLLTCIHQSNEWKNKDIIKLQHVPSAVLPDPVNSTLVEISKKLDANQKNTPSPTTRTGIR